MLEPLICQLIQIDSTMNSFYQFNLYFSAMFVLRDPPDLMQTCRLLAAREGSLVPFHSGAAMRWWVKDWVVVWTQI